MAVGGPHERHWRPTHSPAPAWPHPSTSTSSCFLLDSFSFTKYGIQYPPIAQGIGRLLESCSLLTSLEARRRTPDFEEHPAFCPSFSRCAFDTRASLAVPQILARLDNTKNECLATAVMDRAIRLAT